MRIQIYFLTISRNCVCALKFHSHSQNVALSNDHFLYFPDKLNLSEAEKERRLELQRIDKWSQFCDGEVILKKGFVNKRKGLFARKRMLLLTTGPRLIYVDPVQMVKKGEIPWSADLRVEPKNFKIFFVHTVSFSSSLIRILVLLG